RRKEAATARKILTAHNQAGRINHALGQLGIDPIVPANVQDGFQVLTPALLVEADPEEELYAVHAGWDETERKVRLLLGHYWGDGGYPGLRPGPLVTGPDDIAKARHEGPTAEPAKDNAPSSWDLRKIAEEAARNIPSDVTSHDAGEITQLLSGLAAAVLHLADTVSGTCGRP
ncbi:hypothetical protein, partial [Streptomyces kebangsaanensis]|uniref:hypothetical protein n=1 Tax=Streptomyces kebangsaanensis TaxID=864058 RepID=UPI00093B423B